MERVQGNLFMRDDTFLGVCEELAEDTGIHGNLYRIGFTLFAFFNPLVAIGVYAGVGVFVLALRLLVPNPRVRTVTVTQNTEPAVAVAAERAVVAEEPLALAA